MSESEAVIDARSYAQALPQDPMITCGGGLSAIAQCFFIESGTKPHPLPGIQ
ncbi:MAG: hypothetical protein KME23_22785 [Goleter apudmare HA4340-LM2]|nr:hypothetical protein [Goleter apudmare HA4340-LM2]